MRFLKLNLSHRRRSLFPFWEKIVPVLSPLLGFLLGDRSTLKYGWLVKLERLLNNMDNRNYKDKLALLKARLFREWGEVNQAKEAYRSIKTHPIVKAEATGF